MLISPSYSEFQNAYERGGNQLVWAKIIADLDTPVSAYLKVAGDKPNNFLLESVEGGETRGRYSIIGLNPDLIFEANGNKAKINRHALTDLEDFTDVELPTLAAIEALLEESKLDVHEDLPPMSAGIYGYLGYETIALVEELPVPSYDELQLPDIRLIRPTQILVIDSVKNEVTLVTPARIQEGMSAKAAYEAATLRLEETIENLNKPLLGAQNTTQITTDIKPVSKTSKQRYLDMVYAAKNYIAAGDIFQVVLSLRFSTPFPYAPFSLYRSLRRTNPSPYLFYLGFKDFSVVGSSPEILVKLQDEHVTIRPIAGTRKRGENREEDEALATELLNDPKECAEHLMLLDLGRNDVGRVSELKSVHVTDQFFIERYSHVMHIVSNVVGKIKKNISAITALMAGFPAGTVSGAPKIRAMEIISELEQSKRGVYAGCIGYFSADGSMDTCIALRTAVVKDKTLYVQAGAGIVADSVAELEYEECENKSRALFAAAKDAHRYEEMNDKGHNG